MVQVEKTVDIYLSAVFLLPKNRHFKPKKRPQKRHFKRRFEKSNSIVCLK